MGVIAAIVLGALLPAAAQGIGQQASARPAPLHPLALGSGVERDTRLTNRLRLRVTTVATAAGPREKMRERVGGSMIDLYPSEASGFNFCTCSYSIRSRNEKYAKNENTIQYITAQDRSLKPVKKKKKDTKPENHPKPHEVFFHYKQG